MQAALCIGDGEREFCKNLPKSQNSTKQIGFSYVVMVETMKNSGIAYGTIRLLDE
jgi:hypothetical protein